MLLILVCITYYLQGSVDHCVIGVQLLAQLTAEMNQISESDANKSLTKHRKIASSFRDTQLYDIFQLSCTLLRTALENSKTLNFNDESQHGLMTHLLRLGKTTRIIVDGKYLMYTVNTTFHVQDYYDIYCMVSSKYVVAKAVYVVFTLSIRFLLD